MKLATLRDGSPDGALVAVSRNLEFAASASNIAKSLQAALDDWDQTAPKLRALYNDLNLGLVAQKFTFEISDAMAPLPRAWQFLDASAFPSHGALMDRVFGISAKKAGFPLMYQGMSHEFFSATETIPFDDENDWIDFEGELAVIVGDTPMGAQPDDAAKNIRLLALINDWSLRKIAPVEMATGFGWIQAKPPCSVAPVVVTPDELGSAWKDCKVHLPLHVLRNGETFGKALANEMEYSFAELIAHAAKKRRLCAGTIIGSGTVSNSNFREVGSSCIAERRGIEIVDSGSPQTSYMVNGERVAMEMLAPDGSSIFGRIDQRIGVGRMAPT